MAQSLKYYQREKHRFGTDDLTNIISIRIDETRCGLKTLLTQICGLSGDIVRRSSLDVGSLEIFCDTEQLVGQSLTELRPQLRVA